jgi:hypothetical protein
MMEEWFCGEWCRDCEKHVDLDCWIERPRVCWGSFEGVERGELGS